MQVLILALFEKYLAHFKNFVKFICKAERHFSFCDTKRKVPIKGLEKGDGVRGRGKEPFLKKVFPSSPNLLMLLQLI